MSTNSNCEIIEESRGRWFYILESMNAPADAWDWRENASAYGPFESVDAAEKHLGDNHANPGGYWTCALPEGIEKIDLTDDPELKRLIENAHPPGGAHRMAYRPRW